MTALRRLALYRPALAGFILAAALLMKVLVPAGFMPTTSGTMLIVQICSGYGAQTMAVPMPAKEDQRQGGHQGKEMPCAFSGLAAPSLAAADPVLLASAILFIMVMAVRAAMVFAAAPPAFLRPPLRGPPATF